MGERGHRSITLSQVAADSLAFVLALILMADNRRRRPPGGSGTGRRPALCLRRSADRRAVDGSLEHTDSQVQPFVALAADQETHVAAVALGARA